MAENFSDQFRKAGASPNANERAVETPLPEGRAPENFSNRFRRIDPRVAENVQAGLAERQRIESGQAPAPGMVRIPGTQVDVPDEVGAAARFGLGVVGAMAGPRGIPSGVRGAVRALAVGESAAQAGITAGGAELAGQALFPSGDERPQDMALETGLTSALAETVFGGIGGIIMRRLRQAGNIEPGAREALAQIRRGGGEITAGRLTKNPGVDVAETVAEGSLFGRAGVTDTLTEAERIAQRDIDQFISQLTKGRSKEDIAQVMQTFVREGEDIFRQTGVQGYRELDQAAKGSQVELQNLIQFRMSLSTQGSATPSAIQAVMNVIDGQIERATGRSAQDIYQSIRASSQPDAYGNVTQALAPPRLSFGDAAAMRSELIKLMGTPDFVSAGGEEIAKKAVRIADDEIERAGNLIGLTDPEAYRMFRRVNEYWKNGRESMRLYTMESLIRASPDMALQMIIRPGGAARLRAYRQAIFGGLGENADINTAQGIIRHNKRLLADRRVSPEIKQLAQQRIDQAVRATEAWDGLYGQFLLDAMNKADEAAGVSQKTLFGERSRPASSVLKTMRRYSDDLLNELVPVGTKRKQFDQLLRTLDIVQAPAGKSVPGRIFVQLNQASAAGVMLGSALTLSFLTEGVGAGEVGAATIILGPKALGALVRNPKFVDLMVRASRGGPTELSQRARAFSLLAQEALREGGRVYGADGYEVTQEGR